MPHRKGAEPVQAIPEDRTKGVLLLQPLYSSCIRCGPQHMCCGRCGVEPGSFRQSFGRDWHNGSYQSISVKRSRNVQAPIPCGTALPFSLFEKCWGGKGCCRARLLALQSLPAVRSHTTRSRSHFFFKDCITSPVD